MRIFLVSFLLSIGAPAFAQPQTPDPEKAPAPVVGDSAGSASGIAKPAPDAPPDQVEKAKAVAKKAALTPIIPSPNNPTRPAFQLYAEIDLPILATGLVFAFGRGVNTRPAYCAPLCTDKSGLNALDKWTVGYYSKGWSTASDFELVGLGVGAVATLLLDEGPLAALNDSVVIVESAVSATALASVMTLAAGRPRPYLYSESAPLVMRNSYDAGLSFISSHTAEAFALATSFYIAERRLHPEWNGTKAVLGISLAVAASVGVSRVMAGQHFITDAIGGAIVGSSVGIVVSSLHNSPVHLIPVVNHDADVTSAGLGVGGNF